MATDIQALADAVAALFTGVAKDIYVRFKQQDKDDLAAYARNVAALGLKLHGETEATKRAAIIDNMQSYENATTLMVARYEMIAGDQLEKAGVAALNLAVQVIVKIIIAAV
jgi:hypothetical protein